MSREIKFRVWDGTAMYDATDHPDWTLDNFVNAYRMAPEYRPSPEQYRLMQYTGLKDIQDREVYEGDIVRTNVIEGDEDEPPVYGMVGVVEIAPHGTGFGSYRSSCCERPLIIGNVHENPELIP